MKNYDAIIIGSGQAGNPLSKKLAKIGWKTALIEEKHIGGTCVNVGCTPSKTMIASAKRLYDCRNAGKLGVHTGQIHVNLKEVVKRKDKIVESFKTSAKEGLEETENLEILFGKATFTGKKQVTVTLNEGGKEEISADNIFIDVGCRPSVPSIPGIDDIDYLTSTTVMELEEIPEHLLIIGGGYIGLEFGQMFRRFGSMVTIVDASKRFLMHEDEDVADSIQDFLSQEGVEIIENSKVNKIDTSKSKPSAYIKTGDKAKTIEFSHLLVAAGRKPNTDELNVKEAGIKVDEKGFIEVKGNLETSVEGIYAMGDVKGGPEFTHISYNDHYVVYKNLIENKHVDYHDRLVPYTMFTDPQLGRVGITEQDAKEKGLKIRVATLPMKKVARGIEVGDIRGMMKAVVDKESGQILGAAILSRQGGEIMTVLQMAMIGNIAWQTIAELPIAHPLYSESLNNLFMQLQ